MKSLLNCSRVLLDLTFIFAIVFIPLACGNSKRENLPSNRLAAAGSPYLREHADNPVEWFEWGDEALAKSKAENKPLLISVGYASCHWCHVMERESFMDTAVARFMNDNFVSIKVDREERPDVDQIYIRAAQLISGNAGWPLNAFALPDGRPFYAATYFPKDQWLKLLQQIKRAYQKDYDNVLKQAQAVTNGIKTSESLVPVNDNSNTSNKEAYLKIFGEWQSQLDFSSGGLAGSPKFPMPAVWEYLLQDHYLAGNKQALEAVTVTLDKMAAGGIFDQLGGGFARYSTDENWKVPHFEKMLYDNGQLVSLYAHAYQQTKNTRYAEVIEQTLDFVNRELTSQEGGFYSSINADSEEEEGRFYVWTKTEVDRLLSEDDGRVFCKYYGITDSGNWENQKNILYQQSSVEELAKTYAKSTDEVQRILGRARGILLTERSDRVRPSLDDKIIASWNGLMLAGYLDAYFATGRESYLEVAVKNGRFLESKMIKKDGGVWRSYSNGKPSIEGFLDDYASLANAFLHLYEATFDKHWLELAERCTTYVLQHFSDSSGALLYYTSDESESLIARKMEVEDNVIPSSNSIMAEVLYRLGSYLENDSYVKTGESLLKQITPEKIKNGPYYANWARLIGVTAFGSYEVAVMGKEAIDLTRKMKTKYLPTALFMGGIEENLPLLENKLVKGETIIYVCRNKVCRLPVKDVDGAIGLMK